MKQWWSVPRWAATTEASTDSSHQDSPVEMVKVWMGREDWACAEAVTTEESTPPERNAPRGTSERSRSPTEWSTRAWSSSKSTSWVRALTRGRQ